VSRYFHVRPCVDCGTVGRSERCWDCHKKTLRQERLPYQPLARFGSPRDIAHMTGINPRLVYRWRTEGLIPVTADRVAVALGCHPVEIWPEWFALVEVAS
jgi:hypothetical protein